MVILPQKQGAAAAMEGSGPHKRGKRYTKPNIFT